MSELDDPRTDDDASVAGLPFPRWALWLIVPGVLGPVAIFGFILWSESAHDPDSCPYDERSRIELAAGVVVVEDARRCLDDVEERRFTLLRGDEPRILGRRRFAPEAFSAERYRWRAEIGDEGEVRVRVENDGQTPVLFREGTPEERATGTSR